MMKLYWKKLPKVIRWILYVSVVYALIYMFWLTDQIECFAGVSRLEALLYGLFLAYISSFIFYLLTVHIPKEKAKEETDWFLLKKLDQIISDSRSLMVYCGCNKDELEDILTDRSKIIKKYEGYYVKNELKVVCDSDEMYYIVPQMVKDSINIIYSRVPYINAKIRNILIQIEMDAYVDIEQSLAFCSITPGEGLYASDVKYYIKYLELVDDLENKVKKYYKRS